MPVGLVPVCAVPHALTIVAQALGWSPLRHARSAFMALRA
jgi:hypothetical protein